MSQNGQTPSIIGICSYCVLDRPVFERCQTLLHPELTLWWSFLLADGAHHKKPHSPTHPHVCTWQAGSLWSIWPMHNTIRDDANIQLSGLTLTTWQNNARLKLSCKFGESTNNPYWGITFMTSHDTNYVLNEHLDFSQHDPCATPSELILWYSYSASLKNQTRTLIGVLH